jgi:tRNA(Ile)-lysidine synthase
VHSLSERVLSHIRAQELLSAGDRVGVAVSGGIDSVALLRALLELRAELGIVLSVVHFNHQLRGEESEADQEFVEGLAREYGLEFSCDGEDVAGHAAEQRVSVEAAARELRYGFFRSLLGVGEISPSGAKAPYLAAELNRSAGSAAPPKSTLPETGTADGAVAKSEIPEDAPQGLKPKSQEPPLRGAKAPLFHFASRTGLGKVVTGHTLDDQAETVLMRLIRGSGLRGLGGIHPRLLVEDESGELCGEIVRPLLDFRRCELEQYLNDIGQSWREDGSNTDQHFTRNRVRRLLVPLLEKEFNPAVARSLSELAEIARGEEDYWDNEVSGWMGTAVQWSEPAWARPKPDADGLVQIIVGGVAPSVSGKNPGIDDLQSRIDNAPWLVANASVSRAWFVTEPVAVQRRLLKAVGEQAGIPLEFKHVEEIRAFAEEEGGGSGKEMSLPLGWKVVRHAERLEFITPDLRHPVETHDYEYELSVPGAVAIAETGSMIEVRRVAGSAEYNSDHLVDADSLPGPLRVRNWRPGDRFWPAHTKSPKKIKELLQERHVAPEERRVWPVIVNGKEIIWVRGFRPPAKYQPRPGGHALVIFEKPLREEPQR